MNSIYWIDDNFGKMRTIVTGIFPLLWNIKQDNESVQIKNYIILFGNAYQDPGSDVLYSEEMIEAAKNKLVDFFEEECQTEDGPTESNQLFIKNKGLIKDTMRIVFSAESKSEDLDLWKKIKENWTGGMKKKKEDIEKLIERIAIPEESCVGIDLELLYGDIESAKQGKIIISMELYKQLKKKKCKCFLYTTSAEDEDFLEKWRSKCKEYCEQNEDDTIDIYDRLSFAGYNRYEICKEIKRLCERER